MLSTPVSELKGVGQKLNTAFKKKGISTVRDLIEYLPRRYEDFSAAQKIADLEPGNVTILASIESIETKTVRRGLKLTTAVISDGYSKLKAIWFNQPYRASQLKSGEEFLFSGKFEFSYNHYQLSNPSVEKPKIFLEKEPSGF